MTIGVVQLRQRRKHFDNDSWNDHLSTNGAYQELVMNMA